MLTREGGLPRQSPGMPPAKPKPMSRWDSLARMIDDSGPADIVTHPPTSEPPESKASVSGNRDRMASITAAAPGSGRLIVDPDLMQFELQIRTHPVCEAEDGQICIEPRGARMSDYTGIYHAFLLADSTTATLLALMDDQGRAESAELLALEQRRNAARSRTRGREIWEYRVKYRFHHVNFHGDIQGLDDRVLPNKTYTIAFSAQSETVRTRRGLRLWKSHFNELFRRFFRSMRVRAVTSELEHDAYMCDATQSAKLR